MKFYFNIEDASQVSIGSFAMAVPVSFSEEAWNIGNSLPTVNLIFLFFLSVFFLGFYAHQSVFQGNISNRVPVFLFRILIAYLVSAFIVSLVLFSLNKFPIFINPELAIKRLLVITMPASMGAIIIDSLDKE